MIAEKKTLKKITMAMGVVAMAVGLVTTFSEEAYAETTTGGIGCYNPIIAECGWNFGQQVTCNFTGLYGPPYACTDIPCCCINKPRRCVPK